MTFDNPIVNQCLVESAVVLLLCGLTVFLCAVTTSAGRSLVKAIIDMFRGHRARSVFLIGSAWLLTAYAGTKPPPVIVDRGIELISCVQTPQEVRFKWRAEDKRIKPGAVYEIQEMRDSEDWYTIGSTTETEFIHPRFTIQRYRRWRIAVKIEGSK